MNLKPTKPKHLRQLKEVVCRTTPSPRNLLADSTLNNCRLRLQSSSNQGMYAETTTHPSNLVATLVNDLQRPCLKGGRAAKREREGPHLANPASDRRKIHSC